MAKNQSTKRPSRHFCERMHNAFFGKLHRSPKTHVSSTPIKAIPPPSVKSVVHFSSNNVESDGDVGQKTFNEDKFSTYIDGMKMKMKAPSDIGSGGGMSASRHDSFNDKVSSYISGAKHKLLTKSSTLSDGKTHKP